MIGGFWAWHRGECAETFEEKQVEETVHAVDYISPRSLQCVNLCNNIA